MNDLKQKISPNAQILIDNICGEIEKAIKKSIWDCNAATMPDITINGWTLKYEFTENEELTNNNILECTITAFPPIEHVTINYVFDESEDVKNENITK